MRKTSDSDDDNPLPKGSGTRKGADQGGAQHLPGSESSSYRGTSAHDTTAPSFLYSADVPVPTSEVKSKDKRKKKRAMNTDDEMNNPPINEGQSFDASQSFEHSFESGISGGRTGASPTSAAHTRLTYSDSFKRIEENQTKTEVQGQGPNPDAGNAEGDAKKHGEAGGSKGKFPLKLGRIFRKNKKPERKDASVVETEMSAIPATLPSSGYLEPRSGASSRYDVGGYAAATSYRVAQPQRLTSTSQGQRHMATVSMLPGDEEEEMNEVERLMKEKQRKISHMKICESVLVTVVLVAGFLLGIILTAMSSLGLAFQVVGPTILGLSAFGIIGKIFVTVFWEEDPFRWTQGHLRKVTTRLHSKKNRDSEPPAETHVSLVQNPSYGGDENAPSTSQVQAMTSHWSSETNNQDGGAETPSFSFESTFSHQDA